MKNIDINHKYKGVKECEWVIILCCLHSFYSEIKKEMFVCRNIQWNIYVQFLETFRIFMCNVTCAILHLYTRNLESHVFVLCEKIRKQYLIKPYVKLWLNSPRIIFIHYKDSIDSCCILWLLLILLSSIQHIKLHLKKTKADYR